MKTNTTPMLIGDFLRQHYQLSDDIIHRLEAAGTRKEFSKNQIILEPEHRSTKVYFVEKGLLKLFYYKDIRSITHYFLEENEFMTRSENFYEDVQMQNQSSAYGLMSLENHSQAYVIPYSCIQSLAKDSLEMNKLIQRILLDMVRGFSNRLSSIQFETAQERYGQLLKTNPQIILRAPLGDIASYLGISQQTLSVIRSQLK